MRTEKGNILTIEEKSFNVAKSYLKKGLFENAKEKFLTLQDNEELKCLVSCALKLCDYEVSNVRVEETNEFYEAMMKVAIEHADLKLYREAYEANVVSKNEYFNIQELMQNILNHFNLVYALDFESLKTFVKDFEEVYLYEDMLNVISKEYLFIGDYEKALYFIEEARKLNSKNPEILFNLILCKAKCSNERELIQSSVLLSDLQEFDDLLLLCEDDDLRDSYLDLRIKQSEYLERKEIDAQIAKEKKEKEERRILELKETESKELFTTYIQPLLFVLISWVFMFINLMFVGDIVGLVLATIVPIGLCIAHNVIYKDKYEDNLNYHLLINLLTIAPVACYMVLNVSDSMWGFEDGYAAWGFWNYMGEGTYGWLFLLLPYLIIITSMIFQIVKSVKSDSSIQKPILSSVLSIAVVTFAPIIVGFFEFDFAREVSIVVMMVTLFGVVAFSDWFVFKSDIDLPDWFKETAFPFMLALISWGVALLNHFFVGGIVGFVISYLIPVASTIFVLHLFIKNNKEKSSFYYTMLFLNIAPTIFYMIMNVNDSIWGFEEGVAPLVFMDYVGPNEYGWLYLIAPTLLPVAAGIVCIKTEKDNGKKYILPFVISTIWFALVPLLLSFFGFTWEGIHETGIAAVWILTIAGIVLCLTCAQDDYYGEIPGFLQILASCIIVTIGLLLAGLSITIIVVIIIAAISFVQAILEFFGSLFGI